MPNVLKTKDRLCLPSNGLVIKKIKELRNIQDLGYSLELLKLEVNDKTTLYIVNASNERIGCSVEYFSLEDASEIWYSTLMDCLSISELYINAKNDKKAEGFSVYSQITGSCWFGCYEKIDAFEPALTTVS